MVTYVTQKYRYSKLILNVVNIDQKMNNTFCIMHTTKEIMLSIIKIFEHIKLYLTFFNYIKIVLKNVINLITR